MADFDITGILTLLEKTGLLNAAELEIAHQRAAKYDNPGSAESLLNDLVKENLLTAWQRDQLLRGETGFVLRQYRIQESIGKGGMGHVFRALDRETGATVAIKVMARKLTSNQSLVNRFRREIQATSRLRSPHIVRTLDAGRVGRVDFMVMEFVNGCQLDLVIGRDQVLPPGLACEIVRQAAVGLQHAHDEHMVHRDIKPANLMIDWSRSGRGTVKVMDMGLVRLNAESDDLPTMTQAGQVMGTPDYMSPEQGWDTGQVDIRSDIYSLGCMLFRLLTGRVPFQGGNPLQVLMARCSRDAPSVSSFCPNISEQLNAVVARMTMRDPALRFQVPHDVALALTPFCQHLTRQSLEAHSALNRRDDGAGTTSPESTGDAGADTGYEAFLKEMATGDVTDRFLGDESPPQGADRNFPMFTALPAAPEFDFSASRPRISDSGSPTADLPSVATQLPTPALPSHVSPSPQDPNSPPRRLFAQRSIVVGTAALLPGAGILLFLSLGQINSTPPAGSGVPQSTPAETSSIASIVTPPVQQATAGETFRLMPRLDVHKEPDSGKFVFELDQAAPAAASVNPQTGEIAWEIPLYQSPAEYWLPLKLILRDQGRDTAISSTRIAVNVSAAGKRRQNPVSSAATAKMPDPVATPTPNTTPNPTTTPNPATTRDPAITPDPATARDSDTTPDPAIP